MLTTKRETVKPYSLNSLIKPIHEQDDDSILLLVTRRIMSVVQVT
jgi:hypothetical protein